MKNLNSKVTILSLIVLSLSILAVGCGSAGTPPPALPPAPTVAVPGTTSAAMAAYCRTRNGTVITANGVELCKVQVPVYGSTFLQFSGTYPMALPRLSPNDPYGSNAYSLGYKLRKGDRVFISSSSSWGAIDIDSHSFLWGLFNFTTVTTNCQLVSGDGKGTNGSVLYEIAGMKQGFLASDQGKTYFVGNGSDRSFVAENDGNLVVGFNTPDDGDIKCGRLQINSVRVERCENALGVVQSCS
jgi:hypothetical protein